MKKRKILISTFSLSAILVAFILVFNIFNSNTSADAKINNKTNITSTDTNVTQNENNQENGQNEVTSTEYKSALNDYMEKNPDKIDKEHPTKVLIDFMNENNLDHLTVG